MTTCELPDPLNNLMPAGARPRYRRDFPMVWRETEQLVIWSSNTRAVLDRMDAVHATWLSSLDGLRTWAEITGQLTITPAAAGRIIRTLQSLGALEDATDMPNSWRWLGAVERDAQVGDLAAAVHTYPAGRVALDAIENRQDTSIHIVGTGALANELFTVFDVCGLRVNQLGATPSGPDANRVLVVFADGVHPDIIDDVDTPLHDHPHLPATVYGARAVIGPIVIPGKTSCLRCAYLHTVDADAMWPKVTLQLASALRRLKALPLDRLLVRAAASQTALLIRAWIDQPANPEPWRELAFELRLPGGRAGPIARPPHPLCGCSWPQADPVRAPLESG
ncbi:MAG: hypothetical protein O2943_00060 [Actinomycetota bacterium]|nr:hypothetical protein [Actinomycetota bacterium]